MIALRLAAFAALLAIPTSAFAHNGIVHEGCPTGQSFTQGSITVAGAYLRATLKGAASAGGYLTVSNSGGSDDTLTGITTEAASDVAIHQMKMNGNVMEMSPLEGGLVVPAGGSASLDPMGNHLMLTGFSDGFIQGQCVEMILHFAKAGDIPVEFNIGGVAQDGPPAGDTGVSVTSSGAMDMSSMDMGH